MRGGISVLRGLHLPGKFTWIIFLLVGVEPILGVFSEEGSVFARDVGAHTFPERGEKCILRVSHHLGERGRKKGVER